MDGSHARCPSCWTALPLRLRAGLYEIWLLFYLALHFILLIALSLLNTMDWLHLYIAAAAFSVFALVGLVLLISFDKIKINSDNGLSTYIKFVWANFLKPHEHGGEGQQYALESFYKTQVRVICLARLSGILTASRRPSTMQLADAFSMVGKICSGLWLLS